MKALKTAVLAVTLVMGGATVQASTFLRDSFVAADVGAGENDALNGEYRAATTLNNADNVAVVGGNIVGFTADNEWASGVEPSSLPRAETNGLVSTTVNQEGGSVRFRGFADTNPRYIDRAIDPYSAPTLYFTGTLNTELVDDDMVSLIAFCNDGGQPTASNILMNVHYYQGLAFGIKGDGSGGMDLIVRYRDETTTDYVDTVLLSGASANTDYTFTGKIVWNSTNVTRDVFTIWVNPAGGTEPVSGGTTLVGFLGDPTSLGAVHLLQMNYGTSTSDGVYMDEIGLADSWEDLVDPNPVLPDPYELFLRDAFVTADVGSGLNDSTNGEYRAVGLSNGDNIDVWGGNIVGFNELNPWQVSSAVLLMVTNGLGSSSVNATGGAVAFRGADDTINRYAGRKIDPYSEPTLYFTGTLRADVLDDDAVSLIAFSDLGSDVALRANAILDNSGGFYRGLGFGFKGDGIGGMDLIVRYRNGDLLWVDTVLQNGVSANTDYTIIGKIEWNTGAVSGRDPFTIWVDPASGTEPASGGTSLIGFLGDPDQLNGAYLLQNNFGTGLSDIVYMDEIGLGISWESLSGATIVPDPANLFIQAGSGSITISSDNLEPTVSNMLQVSTDLVAGSWSNLSAITGAATNWVISPLPESESFYRVQSHY